MFSQSGGPIPWSRVYPSIENIRQVYPVWCSRLHNHTIHRTQNVESWVSVQIFGVRPPDPSVVAPMALTRPAVTSTFFVFQRILKSSAVGASTRTPVGELHVVGGKRLVPHHQHHFPPQSSSRTPFHLSPQHDYFYFSPHQEHFFHISLLGFELCLSKLCCFNPSPS